MVKEILLLGNERLYKKCASVQPGENVAEIQNDLHDTLLAFREKYHIGRAIAAPQIGIQKTINYMHVDKPVLLINPEMCILDHEQMEVLDDCMSFPGLLVRVMRYKKIEITYCDINWQNQVMVLEDDLSELLQHEYDHLDGILATMKAIDNRSFIFRDGMKL